MRYDGGMWDLKMKALFLGLSVATVMGLSAGGALKPVTTDFQGGPQSLSPLSAHRAQRVFDETASWTGYGGRIPDYVIGTDWIVPDMSLAAAALNPEPEPPAPAAKTPERVVVEIAEVEEPPAPPTRYPSTGGDILAGMSSYAPPTPPQNVAPAPPPAN
jgi:hypothetical protein